MRAVACVLVLAAAAPARSEEALPPPPPPPSREVPAAAPWRDLDPPDAPPTERDVGRLAGRRGTIGEAPVAAAGSQAAPLHPDELRSHWRHALVTGVVGKFGGRQLEASRENPGVLLYFGAQADGLWSEGYGHATRLRLRLFTGGENEIYVPSEGDAEAAYMIGRREFRFVVGRLEVGRYPALGVEVLAQVATLPCFEGSLSLAGDSMRLYYYLSPIEGAWVHYYGGAHIPHTPGWSSESDRPAAASAARIRYTVLLPPSMLLSLQGDIMKMWQKADLLVAGEASLGYRALDRSAVFNVGLRWNGYTRRGLAPETHTSESEVMLLAAATLAF